MIIVRLPQSPLLSKIVVADYYSLIKEYVFFAKNKRDLK